MNANPFDYFDAIYCINLDRRTDRWEEVQKEFEKVGIRERVVRFSAIETPENGAIGCILSHRAIIQKAKDMGWKNVLVFEDDVKFVQSMSYVEIIIKELTGLRYDLFYFGGLFNIHTQKQIYCYPKSKTLRQVSDLWCTSAISYGETFYDVFLGDYPEISTEGIKNSNIFRQYKSIDERLIHHQKMYICLAPKKIICSVRISPSNISKNSTSILKYIPLLTIKFYWYLAMHKNLYKIFRIVKRFKNHILFIG